MSSVLQINPDLPQCHELRGWCYWVSSSTPSSLAKGKICQLEWSNRPSTRDKNRPWQRTSALNEEIQNYVHLHKADIS